MTTLFRQMLLLGALFGLLWQGVANASPPCSGMLQEQITAKTAMAGMVDCTENDVQMPSKAPPCKDMKAGCFAMAGCAPMNFLNVAYVSENSDKNSTLSYSWDQSRILIGRDEPPIPDPPAILG